MRIGLRIITVLVVVLAFRALPALAGTTYNINARGGGDYASLEELRLAITGGSLTLGFGDVIVIHNDDFTLTDSLDLSGSNDIVIRSNGSRNYQIGAADYAIMTNGGLISTNGDPNLAIQNVRVTGMQLSGGKVVRVENSDLSGATRGALNISNSRFTDNLGDGISTMGNMDITLTNTVITGSNVALEALADGDAFLGIWNTSSNVNIVFDHGAAANNVWDGGVYVEGYSNVNFNIANGKGFTLQGGFDADNSFVVKKGAGTLRFNDDVVANSLAIEEGTVRKGFGANIETDTLKIGSGAVFNTTLDYAYITGEYASYVRTDTLTLEEGARIEISGISGLSAGRHEIEVISGIQNVVDIPGSMNTSNGLLNTVFSQESGVLTLTANVRDLKAIKGVGIYADVYRLMDLSETERDILDSIYYSGVNRGTLGHLQTIGGSIVQDTMLAMRHNQANLTNKINTRLTAYHKDELLPQISGSDSICHSDYDPVQGGTTFWASLDQTLMRQRDVENLAGYRYNAQDLALGHEWHIDNIIVGGALDWTHGKMKLDNRSSTRADVDTLIAALYASWALDGWYLSGTGFVGYGWNSAESDYITHKAETGDFNTSTLGVNAEGGYMMETDFMGFPMRVTPYGTIGYSRIHRSAVTESGASHLNRHFRASNWNAWEGGAGVRISAPIERSNGHILIPTLDAAVIRTNGSAKDEDTPDIWFVDRPGQGWNLGMMSDNRTAYRLAGGLDARIRDNVTIGGKYEFEWRENFHKHQLNITAVVDF